MGFHEKAKKHHYLSEITFFSHCWHSEKFYRVYSTYPECEKECSTASTYLECEGNLVTVHGDVPLFSPLLAQRKILPSVEYQYPECEMSAVPTLNVKGIL
jgi:hypothetical protein